MSFRVFFVLKKKGVRKYEKYRILYLMEKSVLSEQKKISEDAIPQWWGFGDKKKFMKKNKFSSNNTISFIHTA